MNILVLSPTASHPPNSGVTGASIRIKKLTQFLKDEGNKIHFVHFDMNNTDEHSKNQMRSAWDTYSCIEMKNEFIKTGGDVFNIDDWYQDDISKITQLVCHYFHIDIVLINYVFMSKVFEVIPKNIIKIIDTHDKLSNRLELYKDNGIEPGFFYTSEKSEILALNRADIVISIQDDEKKYFSSVTNKKVETINHLEEQHFIPRNYDLPKKIGYIGTANKFNIKSIETFIESFSALNNYPVKLYLGGNICNVIDRDDKNIVKVGFLNTIDDFYKDMDLIINPTILGTGLKIKTIEALSYGVPIISTKIGFDGVISDSKYHQANNTSEMIDLIKTLYENSGELEQLSKLSKNIFTNYERLVKSQIRNIFDINKLFDENKVFSNTMSKKNHTKHGNNESLNNIKPQDSLLRQDPVFIIGYPRSGTTLLQSLIATQGGVISMPETHFFNWVRNKLVVKNDRIQLECFERLIKGIRERIRLSNTAENHIKQLIIKKLLSPKLLFEIIAVDNLIDRVDDLKTLKKLMWVEKTPDHTLFIDIIKRYYPNAKFIYLIRNPEKAIISRRTHFSSEKNWSIDRHAQLWLKSVEEAEKAKEKFPGNVIIIKFEELVENIDKEMYKISKFINLELDINKLKNYKDKSKELILPEEKWKNDVTSQEISTQIAQRNDKCLNSEELSCLMKILGKKIVKYQYIDCFPQYKEFCEFLLKYEYSELIYSLDEVVSISFFRKPFKKVQAYLSFLKVYQKYM